MSRIDDTQESLLTHLNDTLAQPVIEGSIPDIETVKVGPSGYIEPYYVIQFGDLSPGRANMATPLLDDYRMPIYIQAVAPRAKIARRMANRLNEVMVGFSIETAGTVRKRSGGSTYGENQSEGGVEMYVAPASYDLLVQL